VKAELAADLTADKITELREATRAANLVLAELKDVLADVRRERAAAQTLVDDLVAGIPTTVDDRIGEAVSAGLVRFEESTAKAVHDVYARVQRNVDKLTQPILTMIATRSGGPLPEAFDPAVHKPC